MKRTMLMFAVTLLAVTACSRSDTSVTSQADAQSSGASQPAEPSQTAAPLKKEEPAADPEPTRAEGESEAAYLERRSAWVKSASAKLIEQITALNVGTTIGKKIVLQHPKFGCARVTSEGAFVEWDPDSTPREECANISWRNGDRAAWKERTPGRYDYEPGHAPSDDAEVLNKAADLLATLASVTRHEDTSALAERAKALSTRITDQAKGRDAIQRVEHELAELKESRKELRQLVGQIIASHGDGVYEVAPQVGGSSYRVVFGKHALLRTTSTEFKSRGLFSLWVKNAGEQDVTTTAGFTETWKVYEEGDAEEAKGLDREIKAKTSEIAELRKASKAGPAALEKERKLVGEAIQRLTSATSI